MENLSIIRMTIEPLFKEQFKFEKIKSSTWYVDKVNNTIRSSGYGFYKETDLKPVNLLSDKICTIDQMKDQIEIFESMSAEDLAELKCKEIKHIEIKFDFEFNKIISLVEFINETDEYLKTAIEVEM